MKEGKGASGSCLRIIIELLCFVILTSNNTVIFEAETIGGEEERKHSPIPNSISIHLPEHMPWITEKEAIQ